MENRPKVWRNFISENNLDFDYELYESAINGNTELDFFNSWVHELKQYNYLHNHTRMWFASTWIFNLGLPWQLGAKFFFKYLLMVMLHLISLAGDGSEDCKRRENNIFFHHQTSESFQIIDLM